MKHLNLFKLFLLALIVAMLPQLASAHDFIVDGIAYNYNNDGTSVTVTRGGDYTGDIIIPENVTYNDNTYSVTSIGNSAFSYCNGLTSVTIPNSVTSINYWAFDGCSGLTSIVVDGDNYKYDSRDNCNAIIESESNTLITGCKNTVIPNSVMTIGSGAFYGCTGLTSVTIPNSVTSIDYLAFGESGLKTLIIDDGEQILEMITYVNYYDANPFRNCLIETLYLGRTLTWEGAHSPFRDKTSLVNLNLSNSVTSIGNSAFSGCSGLTSATIPNSMTSIGNSAFSGCTGLTSVEIPNSVTTIGESAFSACTGLTSVTIPNSVTSVGASAFSGCTGLTSVTIPNSVTSIGNSAFSYCNGLTSVSIPNSVNSIGRSAFECCSGLTSITIPNSVTSINGKAFSGCNKLRSITSKIENPENVTYGSNIFQGVSTNYCKLYVPTGKVEDYQFTAPWSDFLNILEEGGGGSTTPVYGDVNGDGVVTAADVTAIYDILLGNRKD